MTERRAPLIAVAAILWMTAPAAAQFPPAGPQPQQQQAPPCMADFAKLRDDAQKKIAAIQEASKRHASPVEACKLFNVFSAAEAKFVKFVETNTAKCGIPPQVGAQLKANHGKTEQIRAQICKAAAAPPRPAGPSLSDALGGSAVPDANNIKTGRGTYDTLTGTPLGNK